MAKTGVVLGATTVAVGIAAYAVYRKRKFVSGDGEIVNAEDDEEIEELPCITPDKVVSIFNKLNSNMNTHIAGVMRRIQNSGQNVPQQILFQYLVEHFEQYLQELQEKIFKEYNVTEEDLEQAVDYYEAVPPGSTSGVRNEKVKEATNQLRQLYINCGGKPCVDLPESLTVEKMCIIFEEYMSAVVAAQHAFTEHLHQIKAKGTSVTTAELQEVRQAKISEKVAVVLKKYHLDHLMFQTALEEFNEHPVFQAKIAAVKAKEAAAKQGGGR
mmetsp:Transcript_13854/g.18499  ORF Transcript_13854/g.18499 Transcript_13854/m.18499 type:complete len:270 (-) Transcript_13854:685-1494(-)